MIKKLLFLVEHGAHVNHRVSEDVKHIDSKLTPLAYVRNRMEDLASASLSSEDKKRIQANLERIAEYLKSKGALLHIIDRP